MNERIVEQLVRLSIRVADCLRTATLCGCGLGAEWRREAKQADADLREFIAKSNSVSDGPVTGEYPEKGATP